VPAKMIGGDVPFCVKIWRILTTRFQNTDFQSIFAHNTSAVTPSEKSSVNSKSIRHSTEPKMNIVCCL